MLQQAAGIGRQIPGLKVYPDRDVSRYVARSFLMGAFNPMTKTPCSNASAVVAVLIVLAYVVAAALMSACGLADGRPGAAHHAHQPDQTAKASFCVWACQAYGGVAFPTLAVNDRLLTFLGRVVHGDSVSTPPLLAATLPARGPPR